MALPVYNSQELPDYVPNGSSGVEPQVDQGYDIQAVRLTPERRSLALAHANGILSDGSFKVAFFVKGVKLGLGLSGSTGQGRYTRDFYPRNITIPEFQITAQCLDQQDYATLVEFVHQAQKNAVGNSIKNFTQLDVSRGGLPGGRTMKGIHKSLSVQGFIPTIRREHKQFVYAPEFIFGIIVQQSLDGLYKDAAPNVPTQESWVEILEGLTAYSQAPKGKAALTETAPGSKPTSIPPEIKLAPGSGSSFETFTESTEP